MRQQINLYQPIFSEDRKALSAGSVVIGLGLVIACLAGIFVHTKRPLAALEATVQSLRDQVSTQAAELAQTTESQEARPEVADPEARFKQLTTTVSERERALQIVQSGAAGQTSGFAARLEALAKRHVAGLWLDNVKLSGTSPSMALQGAATDPSIVPIYLRSLADDAVLAGTRFDEFVIHRFEPKKSELETADDTKQGSTTVRFSAGSTSLPRAIDKEPSS